MTKYLKSMPALSSKEINDLFEKVDYPAEEKLGVVGAEHKIEKARQHLKQYVLKLVGKWSFY